MKWRQANLTKYFQDIWNGAPLFKYTRSSDDLTEMPFCNSQWPLHFLMTLCSPWAVHIQEKSIPGAHKARKGLRRLFWLHSVSPCCFLRNMCDLKDKVMTEGRAGIFHDLPRAAGSQQILISLPINARGMDVFSLTQVNHQQAVTFFCGSKYEQSGITYCSCSALVVTDILEYSWSKRTIPLQLRLVSTRSWLSELNKNSSLVRIGGKPSGECEKKCQ